MCSFTSRVYVRVSSDLFVTSLAVHLAPGIKICQNQACSAPRWGDPLWMQFSWQCQDPPCTLSPLFNEKYTQTWHVQFHSFKLLWTTSFPYLTHTSGLKIHHNKYRSTLTLTASMYKNMWHLYNSIKNSFFSPFLFFRSHGLKKDIWMYLLLPNISGYII